MVSVRRGRGLVPKLWCRCICVGGLYLCVVYLVFRMHTLHVCACMYQNCVRAVTNDFEYCVQQAENIY